MTSPSDINTGEHKQTPILQMGNITKYPNSIVPASDSSDDGVINKTTAGVSAMNLPKDVHQEAEIICISVGLVLLIVSILIIACLTKKIKRQKENCCTPAQSRRRLLYNAYECIDELKSQSIVNNAYSTYSLSSSVDKDAVYQDIQDIKRRDDKRDKKHDRSSIACMLNGLESVGKIVTVARSKTWSHSEDFKERTLPRKSSSMGNERRPEMFVRYPLSNKAPPRIEFRCKVPRTPPPPVPCLPPPDHAKTFHVREYCSAPELPRPRPHSDFNVLNEAGSKRNVRHTVFLQPANTYVQKTQGLPIVRMSNLSDNLGYSDAIYAEPKDTLLENEAKTSLTKSKDSAFDYDSDAEDETIWEDNPIYEDSDSLSDTDYTTSTLDYSESNVMFRIGCFGDYDDMGNEFIRKTHIYSEIPEIK
ncbi:uncharacterized protein LOC117118282 isoform X2 [Anneissia japonica]|uniref:uncharacterized protein LOC117118282 isoform X2 n=1 Tax=Anneissia japonica TaxID=1529436 RepID=UPI001425A52A|nr:uncharacterized protein LOC117118282 isoform X2 [Anneissia japonica]